MPFSQPSTASMGEPPSCKANEAMDKTFKQAASSFVNSPFNEFWHEEVRERLRAVSVSQMSAIFGVSVTHALTETRPAPVATARKRRDFICASISNKEREKVGKKDE